MTPKIVASTICAVSVLFSMTSYAEVAPPSGATLPSSPSRALEQPNTDLRYNLPLDLTVTSSGIVLALTLELLAPQIAPTACRWCDRDANGQDSLNGFDATIRNNLRWSDTKTANTASNVFSYALAPLSGIGIGALIAWRDERMSEFPVDLLVVAEAAVIAVNVNQVTKLAFARERPDIHARSPADRAARRAPDDNLSFYSGHTTLSFALAVSAGTVASMRRHRLAPLMWVAGMALATTSGYLRIAADRHYATDVITGAIVGSALGFGIPYLGHRPETSSIRIGALPTLGGAGLVVSGPW